MTFFATRLVGKARDAQSTLEALGGRNFSASRNNNPGLAAKSLSDVYEAGGALLKLQYPSGRWVSYENNGMNLAKKVVRGESGSAYFAQDLKYKPSGAPAGGKMGMVAGDEWTEVRECCHLNTERVIWAARAIRQSKR